MTKCIVCKEEIKEGAKKCLKCNSYQDWRHRVKDAESFLALLVALVSVIIAAVPVFAEVFSRDYSEVQLSIPLITSGLESISGEIYFTYMGNIIVSNSGNKPASIDALALFMYDKKNNEYKREVIFESGTVGGGDFLRKPFQGQIPLNEMKSKEKFNFSKIKGAYFTVEVTPYNHKSKRMRIPLRIIYKDNGTFRLAPLGKN